MSIIDRFLEKFIDHNILGCPHPIAKERIYRILLILGKSRVLEIILTTAWMARKNLNSRILFLQGAT